MGCTTQTVPKSCFQCFISFTPFCFCDGEAEGTSFCSLCKGYSDFLEFWILSLVFQETKSLTASITSLLCSSSWRKGKKDFRFCSKGLFFSFLAFCHQIVLGFDVVFAFVLTNGAFRVFSLTNHFRASFILTFWKNKVIQGFSLGGFVLWFFCSRLEDSSETSKFDKL